MSFSRATRWQEDGDARERTLRYRQMIVVAVLILAVTETLILAGCSSGIPQPGDEAPSFELDGAHGQPVALSELLQDNEAVVLVFYRGFF